LAISLGTLQGKHQEMEEEKKKGKVKPKIMLGALNQRTRAQNFKTLYFE
jgi:hypothetical protein